MKRWAEKRDSVEESIVAALCAYGATVERLSGSGMPDLLVGYGGQNWLFEVKSGNKGLTQKQEAWHAGWNGHVVIVRSAPEAICIIAGY